MLHSNYWIVGRWLELHTLTSVDLAVQIKRTTLSKDCNTRTGLHFKNVSTFPSKRLWLQPLTWTLCRNKMKFLIKDLIIALEISLLSSIPRGEETLNFKVSNFLPKKTEKDTFAWKWMFNFWKKKVRGTFSTTFHNLFCSGQTGGAGLAIFKWYADTFFFLAIYIWKYEKCMGWNIHTHSHTFCSTEN